MAHDHGHDSHDPHSHDAHGGHADEHGHGAHGHEEHWGDYNAQPPGPNPLPPMSRLQLLLFGVLLALLLGAIVRSSIAMANAKKPAHAEHPAAHEAEGAEPKKKHN